MPGLTGPVPAEDARSIVWLASYPKSGNTWLRALLTNCLRPDRPASINELVGGYVAASRATFDEVVGLDSSDLTPRETLGLRPLFHRLLAVELPQPTFVKTHHAHLRVPGGGPLFPPETTAGAVYVVRNPLDVAVSFAHHSGRRVGWAVRSMNDPAFVLARQHGGVYPILPEALLSWSGHVTSWLDQRAIPVHVVRYEDMHADAVAALRGVVEFAGLSARDADLHAAADRSAFARLREEEAAVGFHERQPTAPSFFRAGVVGAWRTGLSMRQARMLTAAHRSTMARFGYLDGLPPGLQGTP